MLVIGDSERMTVLTIGILSLPSRQFSMLPRLMRALEPQIIGKPVQLIILTDNKFMTVGKKRQHVMNMAEGQYLVCIDDDDMITSDYVDTLLEAAKTGADCLVFKVLVKDRVYEKICDYSISYTDTITSTGYLRKPNHICAVKTAIAQKAAWPDLTGPEDFVWSEAVYPYLKTETKINKVLYHYEFNPETTEGQVRSFDKNKPAIDIVILSYAKTDELKRTTGRCLQSLFRSEVRASDLFNVYVLESEDGVSWSHFPNTQTIKPPLPYGYNKFMNFGRKLGSAEYVCLCNNDLIFQDNWARNMLHVADNFQHVSSFSPACPVTHASHFNLDGRVLYGYAVRQHVAGWCLFQRRRLYDVIDDLDEQFIHWYADDDYANTLKSKGLNHALVTGSLVQHVSSQGATTAEAVLSPDELNRLTHGQQKVFKDKWKL